MDSGQKLSGVFQCRISVDGEHFIRVNVDGEHLIRFPDENSVFKFIRLSVDVALEKYEIMKF